MATAHMEPGLDVDKLSYEIFSILESKFLFGYDDPKLFGGGGAPAPGAAPRTPPRAASPAAAAGKVCILSIDGGGRAADGLLAGAALVRLEASLRRRTGDPAARLADFFDVAAGSGAGGVLAAMLVARSPHGRPLFSAEDALGFLLRNLRRGWSAAGGHPSRLRALFRRPGAAFRKVFGDLTLRDTVRPVLIPCYDLATGGPFLFSRADAVETAAYDFRLREVCAATCAGAEGAVETRSVDGRTRIAAVGGGVALGNPTAAAITHVLNNKREFPLAAGVQDLLVVSIGSGEGDQKAAGASAGGATSSEIVRIAAEGVADMAIGTPRASRETSRAACGGDAKERVVGEAEEMLSQKNVESVLFRGKKLAEQTNAEKLEWFAHELLKEHDRRKASPLPPPAIVKQRPTPPPPAAGTSPANASANAAAANGTASTAPGRMGGNHQPPTSYSNLVSQMLTSIL